MPAYELMYFDFEGRGEVPRYLFALAGVEYTDTRVKNFPELKPNLLFGGLPELKIDGKSTFCQTGTISKYLASQFGFLGKTKEEQYLIDMIFDCMVDVQVDLVGIMFAGDDEKKAEQGKKFMEKLPFRLGRFDSWLSNNKGDWFVGDSISLADLQVAHTFTWFTDGFKDEFKKYENLVAHSEKVFENPKIAAWIKKRDEMKAQKSS